jgi:hypothetical protein
MGFSEIFKTGELPSNWSKESLIADGLNGWACCSLGVKPPDKFGEGMAIIASIVGTATPDGLDKLADEIIANKINSDFSNTKI